MFNAVIVIALPVLGTICVVLSVFVHTKFVRNAFLRELFASICEAQNEFKADTKDFLSTPSMDEFFADVRHSFLILRKRFHQNQFGALSEAIEVLESELQPRNTGALASVINRSVRKRAKTAFYLIQEYIGLHPQEDSLDESSKISSLIGEAIEITNTGDIDQIKQILFKVIDKYVRVGRLHRKTSTVNISTWVTIVSIVVTIGCTILNILR